MTIVMSKLRDFSDRTGIPYPALTRTISGTIVALYAAKLSYPYLEKYLIGSSVNDSKCHTKPKQLGSPTVSSSNAKSSSSSCRPENDETLRSEINFKSTNCREDDYLVQIAEQFDRKFPRGKSSKTPSERYLTFGPERQSIVMQRLESLVVRLLLEIRHLTGFNVDFVIQMIKLIRIMIPSIASKEIFLLVAHTVSLMSRTFLSIYVANLDGQVVKYIVRKDLVRFTKMLTQWLLIAVPATFLNSLIRFLESKLALAFRSRLVSYAYGRYFTNETYYSVSNLDGRLENADHSLTDDISAFAGHCAHLYSSVTKPLLDVAMILATIFTMSRQIAGGSGFAAPLAASGIVFCTHVILRKCSPQFGVLVSEEASRKGYLRSVHARVITNAEEIAFYRGGAIEQSVLERAYNSLVTQTNLIYHKKLWYIMLEQLMMKYLWSATGIALMAAPIMLNKNNDTKRAITDQSEENSNDLAVIVASNDISDRTQYMMTAKNILISGSDALERLFSSYKELIELVGYSNRVSKMFTVFEEVSQGQYKRESVVKAVMNGGECAIVKSPIKSHVAPLMITFRNGVPEAKGVVIEVDDFIRLDNVPVVTPNCDIVVSSLSFTMTKNMHLLITGPNGCGKSSLFRILAGLWPVFGGRLERPSTKSLFYIPQRPYMSLGTLREQLIYPDTLEVMRSKKFSDKQLEEILDSVHLKHVVRREGGWDARADWKDILSGGEKQRLGMARLFYHKPQFALLDECTSAVSIDVEGKMYELAKSMGISLISITHRPSLWRFHTHLLQFDGQGGWRLEPLDTNSRLSLREEKEKLEHSLNGVPEMTIRYQELCSLLGENETAAFQQLKANEIFEDASSSSTECL